MNELIDELKKLVQRVKNLENASLIIKTLVFGPTNVGRFSPPKYTTDPSSPVEGDVWYNLTTHKLRVRTNTTNVDLH